MNTMKQRPGLHLFVVSDRNDKIVSYRSQLEFVERVKAYNLPITHITATATDKDHHNLLGRGLQVAAECVDQDHTSPNSGPVGEVPQAEKWGDHSPSGPVAAKRFVPGQQPAVVTPPPAAAPQVAVAQKVVLYEEDPNDPAGKRFVGSAIWRTETISPGPGKPELAIRADVEIPDRKLAMTLVLRRNTDQVLPASHTIEITFKLPPDFPAGGISNVPGILMKPAEQTRGIPLAGSAAKVTNGYFLIGLSPMESEKERNIQMLKERAWLDIPLVYNNGRRAILAVEKGAPGERAFAEGFQAWEQTSAASQPDQGLVSTPATKDQSRLTIQQSPGPTPRNK